MRPPVQVDKKDVTVDVILCPTGIPAAVAIRPAPFEANARTSWPIVTSI
jgi:hypothetical protein